MTNITLDRRELLAPLFPDQADWLDDRYAAFSRGANEQDLHLFLVSRHICRHTQRIQLVQTTALANYRQNLFLSLKISKDK